MKIEASFDGTDVDRFPLFVDGDKEPDVIRFGDGTLYVLVGKPLDGREAHFRYRPARVHHLPFVKASIEGEPK